MLRTLEPVASPFRGRIRELAEALDHASLVPAAAVAPDVVTMNSRVRARDLDTDRVETFTLVYHGDSEMFDSRLSVLTAMGIATLGARVGDIVEWPARRGTRRMVIEEILYQPEAAGDFDR